MAEPPSSRHCHPFHSRERVNFPDFSPIFSRHVTPESAKGFHWSIDHIARLKPADIDTDPVSLIKTNGESPENDGERQGVADTFFSQRSILPSPWPTATRQRSNLRQGLTPGLHPDSVHTPVGHPKKVTFSPHPPSTAYISSDSMEVENKENAMVNVATQTAITIPLSYNLRDLLGSGCVYSETDGGVRDLANTSLRRKLFGQPNKGSGEEEEEEEDEEEDGNAPSCRVENLTSVRCQSCDYSHLSSTPLKSRSSNCPHAHLSPSPLSPPIFSAHHPTGCCRPGNPTSSSLVSTPGVNLPQLSPIETDGRGAGEGSKVNSNTCKRLFSLSPHPQSVSGPHHTPSPPTCPPFSPILSHSPSEGVGGAPSDGVRGVDGDNGCLEPCTPCRVSSSPSKTTSTPYRNGDAARQQEVTGAVDHDVGRETAEREGEGGERGENQTNSEDLPQPISLADLQTYCEEDLTSVTGITTCTSYFTQLATDDSRSTSERHPLHSTVAVQNSHPLVSDWRTARLRLPSIREISQINDPSIMGAATDSGVAGSLDFNQPPGSSLMNSRGPGNSGGIGSPMQKERENGATSRQNSQPQLVKSEVDSGLVPSPDHAPIGHTPKKDDTPNPREQGSSWRPQDAPQASTPVSRRPNITPSRYSTSHLHRNKFGVPLFVSQKFPTCRHPLLCGNLLPSQLRLLPPRQTPPTSATSSREETPSRLTGLPNWFGESPGGSGHTPLFPDEVIRRKATLKAQLQLSRSPAHSRSPLSNTRQPLIETLNLPSPASSSHFSTLPPSPLPARHHPS